MVAPPHGPAQATTPPGARVRARVCRSAPGFALAAAGERRPALTPVGEPASSFLLAGAPPGLNPGSGSTLASSPARDPGLQTLDIDIRTAQITAALALAQLDDPSCALEPLPIEGALLTPGVCE